MPRNFRGNSPYAESLGRAIMRTDVEERSVEVTYQASEEFTNRMGTVSGGVFSGMLDSLTGLAALIVLPEDRTAAHTKLEFEYLRPARPGRLVGQARVIAMGERDIQSRES
jgi:uncharacterized protein (TIGR00369 family)